MTKQQQTKAKIEFASAPLGQLIYVNVVVNIYVSKI